MNAPRFEHHRENDCPVLRPLTTRPRIDRITTPAKHTKYKGEGICLGAEVTGAGRPRPWRSSSTVTGQVWAAHPEGKGFWWVVDAVGGAWVMHEVDMLVTGQALAEQDVLDRAAS